MTTQNHDESQHVKKLGDIYNSVNSIAIVHNTTIHQSITVPMLPIWSCKPTTHLYQSIMLSDAIKWNWWIRVGTVLTGLFNTNSLSAGGYGCDFECVDFKHNLEADIFIVNWTLRNNIQWYLNQTMILDNEFQNVICKIKAIFPQSQSVKSPETQLPFESSPVMGKIVFNGFSSL